MFKAESQFINIIKYESQLKINYKKLNNDEIVSANQASFLLHDNILSKDIIFKVSNLKEDVLKTYISSLILSSKEKIVQKSYIYDKEEYFSSKLNNDYSLLIEKSKLFEVEHYFKKIGFDYIFSPFQILNMHNEQNPSLNSLSVLIIDYHVYTIIINENNKIVYSNINKLSSFEDIKSSNFYTDDLEAQKLYDEIYYLELTNFIKEIISLYYSKKNVSFIDKITILYRQKQLSSSQIENFKNDILLDVNYHKISIDESLYELSRVKDSSLKSYVKPKEKKVSYFKFFVAISLTFIITALSYIFYDRNQNTYINEETIKQENIIKEKILLPNHIVKNRMIQKTLLKHFDTIPYNVVLKKLTINNTSSELVCELLNNSTYIKVMRPRFLIDYRISNVEYFNSEDIVKEVLITNSKKIFSKNKYNIKLPNYISDEFIPIKRVTEQLKNTFPNNSNIKFLSSFKSVVSTFNYEISLSVSNPMEVFDLIENLNEELYSINISLPLSMELNDNDEIKVKLLLQFHQNI